MHSTSAPSAPSSLRLLVLLAAAALSAECSNAQTSPATLVDSLPGKPRVLILSDIGNEPDDQMSLIRYLVYSNEYDTEGLVATTSTWQRDTVRTDIMMRVIDAYGHVQARLSEHADGFPTTADLKSLVASGPPAYGIAALEARNLSSGAELIVLALDREDPRPLWIAVWGGANTLAQALGHLRATRSPDELSQLVSRLRVYSISDQDDAGPWIRREFPGLFYVVSPSPADGSQYYMATWTGIAGDRYYENAPGADFSTVTNEWLDEHIRDKGPLGRAYPRYLFIMEGDTPSFLHLIGNGLAGHYHPGWGGWGGRYVHRTPYGETRPIWTQGGDAFPGSANARDTVVGRDGQRYTSDQATIWRWREEFQHDFAARMDWTMKDFESANHNPEVVVNGEAGKQPIRIDMRVGTPAMLDASGTHDPDGDSLTYTWFAYPEAQTGSGFRAAARIDGGDGAERIVLLPPRVTVSNTNSERASVLPNVSGEAHIILRVQDDGMPRLTSYRRVILNVRAAIEQPSPTPDR